MPTRHEFCRAAGAALLVPAFLRPFAAMAATPNSNILVSIMLAGGNDGLNTVIPLKQFGAYTDLRKPTSPPSDARMAVNIPLASLAATAFDADYSVPASKASTYAFHPNMTALRKLYGLGKVAVINGVGIPPADTNRLSHATGQFDWQSGTINKSGGATIGWLGQVYENSKGGKLPAMVSLSGEAPILMLGQTNGPLALSSPLEAFNLYDGTWDDTDGKARIAQFRRTDGYATGSTAGEFVRAMSDSADDLTYAIQDIAKTEKVTDYPAPTTYLGQQLQQIARLVLSGAGTSAYFAVQGGYDSHSAQQSSQPSLLADLSDSIATFYTYLAKKGASRNVTIMTFSDFGRRAEANSTLGTDHGTSSVAFAVGDPVKGGTYGQYSKLTSLDQDGNLFIEVDFRQHLAEIIGHLGGDPVAILGKTYPKLGFL
jgi:uncharacterized protein (DUF1501 family)